jgi:parallel beta-helix repeat protein
MVIGTTVSDNVVSDANYRGIVVGRNTDATVVTRNRVTRTANEGIFLWGGSNPVVTGNRVELAASYGIYAAKSLTGRLSVLDNTLRETNTGRSAWVDVVHVEAGSALTTGEVRRTTYSAPVGNLIDRLVESDNPQIMVADNVRSG